MTSTTTNGRKLWFGVRATASMQTTGSTNIGGATVALHPRRSIAAMPSAFGCCFNTFELGPGEQDGNVVLEFSPRPEHDMLIACLWSHWTGTGEPDLLSFAAITDEPPAEVAAAGHDRCIIPIKPENIDAWLNPDRGNLAAQYAILDDRDRPFYEHRMAA